MAPLSSVMFSGVEFVLRNVLEKRFMEHTRAVDQHQRRPESQARVLLIIALTISTFSVASSLLTFYWFIKMRRSFRHDLIMLLIQSDMFKSLWFMVYPIVTYMYGKPTSHSTFCQVNGFFLAFGIEASDFSVLIIAIHSALCIFKSNNSGNEGGLYPYRRYAFTAYLLIPLLLASIPFVNGGDAYISSGTYCYLPVRPLWYRLTLSWIPRYVIFVIILGIYASIYFYVRYKLTDFAEQQSSVNDQCATKFKDLTYMTNPSAPSTPPLVSNGLLPDVPEPSLEEPEIQRPMSSQGQKQNAFARRGSVHQFMILASFTSKADPQIPSPLFQGSDSDSFIGPRTPRPLSRLVEATQSAANSTKSVRSSSPSRSRNTSWQDNFVTRFSPPTSDTLTSQPAVVDIQTVLRRSPDGDGLDDMPELCVRPATGHNPVVDLEMLRTRDKIRRQLRHLFIYPIVYMGMWIVPFISHILNYQDRYFHDPPFILSCVSTICICMQAGVDSWLFCSREKPWRHIPNTKGGFWVSLKFWTGWRGVSRRKPVKGPGRTREEMVKEARNAYKRRDAELAQLRTTLEAGNDAMTASLQAGPESSRRKSERSWWEDETGSFEGEDVDPKSKPATTT